MAIKNTIDTAKQKVTGAVDNLYDKVDDIYQTCWGSKSDTEKRLVITTVLLGVEVAARAYDMIYIGKLNRKIDSMESTRNIVTVTGDDGEALIQAQIDAGILDPSHYYKVCLTEGVWDVTENRVVGKTLAEL